MQTVRQKMITLNLPHLVLTFSSALLVIVAIKGQMSRMMKVTIIISALVVVGTAVYLLLHPYVQYDTLVSL